MNLYKRLTWQFLLRLVTLLICFFIIIFFSSELIQLIIPYNKQAKTVPVMYQVQYFIFFILFILMAVFLVAFLFGKTLGAPLLHMLVWVQSLTKEVYYEPKNKNGIPYSQKKNGQLKRSYQIYIEVIEALNQLTTMLKKGKQERELLEKTREEWMTGISHDLKTPISTAKGYAELLSSEIYNWDKQEVRNFGSIIRERMDYMEELIEDFNLTFQLKNNDLPLHKENCDLVELVRLSVIDTINRLRIEDNYDVQYNPEVEYLYVNVDQKLLRRAFDNFLINSINHNPSGTTVEVSIKTFKERSNHESIQITIKDNGVGMDSNTIAQLFDRYYRGTDSDQSRNGSGLGMAISKQIIESHQGRIEIHSETGKGTTFEILLIK